MSRSTVCDRVLSLVGVLSVMGYGRSIEYDGSTESGGVVLSMIEH